MTDSRLGLADAPLKREPLSSAQAVKLAHCKKAIDGILSANEGQYVSAILFPLTDPRIRIELRQDYGCYGYLVEFLKAPSGGQILIELRRRGGMGIREDPAENGSDASSPAPGIRSKAARA